MNIKRKQYYIFCVIILLLNLSMILLPTQVVTGARDGLKLWVTNVVPALFPFLVGTSLLTMLGFVKFVGVLLTPIMQPVFGVNGVGAFPLISGLTSGYPIGAKITCELYKDGTITKNDATKLLCFTNNCGPLFIIGAVGIGMLKSATAGYFILAVHICSALFIGIIINLILPKNNFKTSTANKTTLRNAYSEMNSHLVSTNKTIGELLSDSIYSSVVTILVIGGFIVIFSVITNILKTTNFTYLLLSLFNRMLPSVIINRKIFDGLVYGIIEMTNGCNLIGISISRESVTAICFLVTFGGFSIHFQTLNFISKTDLNSKLYLFVKFCTAIISAIACWFFYPLIIFHKTTTTFNSMQTTFFDNFLMSTVLFIAVLLIIFLTIIYITFTKYKNHEL